MAITPARTPRKRSILPGFGPALGCTLLYLSFLVIVPLATLVIRGAQVSPGEFWQAISSPRALASYRLSFGAAIAAAGVNVVFGGIVAWVLVRYQFVGRKLLDALVDLPFALPTAVAGIALTSLYAPTGWIGSGLAPLGLQVAYTGFGVLVALVFVGLPFVVRTVQPVLAELDAEVEDAAHSLGAGRWQTFLRVLLPELGPALATGFALALARGLGEYGSVVFIAGNMPMKTEITPLLIVIQLEQYDYAGATSLALVMLGASFSLLLLINFLQHWAARRQAGYGD